VTFASLQRLTRSLAPIVDHRYFLFRGLSSIRDAGIENKNLDDKVFDTIWGGRYYDLKGIRVSKEKGTTDLDLYLQDVNIGKITPGLTTDELLDTLQSDQGVVMSRSGITGKPRDVAMIPAEGPRPGDAQGAGSITGDVRDRDVDIGSRAYRNLLRPQRFAREAIFPGRNGFPRFGLFNGQGKRADEVPPDVAMNRRIPSPHTARLQVGLGCIGCHSLEGTDGMQPLRNDVEAILGITDIYDDLSLRDREEAVQRIANKYTGDFSLFLRRSRDDLARLTLEASGPWEGGEATANADVCRRYALRLETTVHAYWYDLVTPRQALLDIGLDVPDNRAAEALQLLCPPDLRGEEGTGFVPEDPTLALLKAGVGVNRSDWGLSQNFVAERIERSPLLLYPKRAMLWLFSAN
jgi:hypothetical protein